MPASEKDIKYDFSDVTRTDSQKWKQFVKDLLHYVMTTHGPLGALADSRTNKFNEAFPSDNLWGLTEQQPFCEQFHSTNEKTFTTLKDTWFKIQMLIYSILDSSFLASDTELVNKYSYSAARGTMEQFLKTASESGNSISDDYAALLVQFVPFGSFLLYHLDKKYGVEEATDAISMLIAHDDARNSFKDGSKADLQKWCNNLGTTWFNLKRVAAKHDPEHLASLQTLMVIHNKGGPTWKDWVTNLLHQPDWKGRSIKIGDVMHAVMQSKTFGHTAQASSGEEKVHYLSQGRGRGQRGMRGARGGARGGRGGYPQGRGAPSNIKPKICEKAPCNRPVTFPQHRFCTPCFKADRKREKDEADNDALGANVAEEVRTKKQRKNRKKRAQEASKRAASHEGKLIEVRETELSAQGGKSVKTESALQLVTTSNSNSSNVVSGCRYLKSVKTPKAGVTIRKKPRQRPISIAASSPDKAQISSKKNGEETQRKRSSHFS